MCIMEDSVKSFLQIIDQKCSLEQEYFLKDLTDGHKKAIKNANFKEYIRYTNCCLFLVVVCYTMFAILVDTFN